MSSFDTNHDQVVYYFADKQSKGAFLTKVFGMMFICLLITTVVAAGVGYGFQTLLINTAVTDASTGEVIFNPNLVQGLLVALGVSVIALLVMSFYLPISFARGRHNILIPLLIYVVLMGLLLSTFTFMFDWVILVEAFGITAIVFGVMGFLGYISKGRLVGIGGILSSLILGALLLSLVNYIMIFVTGTISQTNATLSWIVSLAIFAFLMLVTLYDVYRIKRIAEAGAGNNNNLVYYCAYILYSDFISILIRVIYYLGIFSNRRN